MSGDAWNPEQYDGFRDQRRRPFRDLLALLRPRRGTRVLDLGCGTGEPTAEPHRSLSARETLGIDSSPAMLEKCRAFEGGGLRFALAEIASVSGQAEWDVIFSNAALHWVPDHQELLERLSRALTSDGQSAVQVPASFEQPTHLAAVEVAQQHVPGSAGRLHATALGPGARGLRRPQGFQRGVPRPWTADSTSHG